MSEYTKGPWKAELGEVYEVRDAEDGRICIITNLRGRHGLGGRRADGESASNARLIAAAPELLEALKEMVFVYADQERGYDYFLGKHVPTVLKTAKAAIAKAEGR